MVECPEWARGPEHVPPPCAVVAARIRGELIATIPYAAQPHAAALVVCWDGWLRAAPHGAYHTSSAVQLLEAAHEKIA
jgi:predicted secreted Zn-dependent protease